VGRRAILLAYAIMYTAPIYAIVGFFLGSYNVVPGSIVVLPVFIVYVPAALYVLTRRCKTCGALLNTTASWKALRTSWAAIPVVRACPECGAPTELA
jgi:rubredoxin